MTGTVLIIDDDPLVRQMVDLALTQAGYTVANAASGEAGVEALRHTRARLVLLDVQMPGMSGISVLEVLRRNGRGDVPVVMLTSRGDADTVRAALANGAAGYIVKPFKAADLLRRVDALLKPAAPKAPPSKPVAKAPPPPAKPADDKDSFMLD